MRKKTLVLVLLFIAGISAVKAQDTVYPFSANYPVLCFDSACNDYIGNIFNRGFYIITYNQHLWDSALNKFHYTLVNAIGYTPNTGEATITGVALPYSFPWDTATHDTLFGVLLTFDSNDYDHPHIHQSANYVVRGMPYNYHIALHHESKCGLLDTVIDAYAFYFDTPIIVTDTFGIGFKIKVLCNPAGEGGVWIPLFTCSEIVPRSDTNAKNLFVYSLHDDGSVWESTSQKSQGGYYYPYCPILSIPDTDSFSCPEVEGLAFAGMYAGNPTLLWDTAEEHELYQLAYGPYDAPVDSLCVVEAQERFVELFDRTLSEDIYYQARLRARCHHRCPVHDTVMWTEWSEPVFFYTGDSMPDTTHRQPIGVAPIEMALPFAIVPNPATGGRLPYVVIDPGVVLQGVTLTLHDGTGREVLHMAVHSHRFTLQVGGMPAGVYTATLSSPQGQSTLRVVVE